MIAAIRHQTLRSSFIFLWFHLFFGTSWALLSVLPPTSSLLNTQISTSISGSTSTCKSSAFLSSRRRLRRREDCSKLKETTSAENKENYLSMLECSKLTKQTFQGKSVLLTGASGGLGKALALELARCKVGTLVLSGRSEEALNSVAKSCQEASSSSTFHVLTCDLGSRESVARLGEQALLLCDTIDVLINNGGVSSRSNFLDTKLEVDERVMQINFFAGAALAKILVPNMVANQSGKIIWISSVQGLVGIPSRTSYAASKFAVQGYCEALRAELASSGVSVHVISPGYIKTNLSRSALTGDGKAHGKMDATTARGADPKEVAVTVLNSVAKGKVDFIVAATASAKIAIWLRLLYPSLLRTMLVKRFKKAEKEKEE